MNKCTTLRSNPYRDPYARLKRFCLPLLLLLASLTASAQEQRVTLSVSKMPIKAVLKELELKGRAIINYSEEVLDTSLKVTIKLEQATVRQSLNAVLQNTGYDFIYSGGAYIIRRSPVQQKGKLSGRVMDEENGEAVPEVTVRILEIANTGTRTDMSGYFNLELPNGQYQAEISSIGYEKKLVRDIVIRDNAPFELNLTIKRSKGSLQGVVVTSSVKKESIASLYLKQKNNTAISDGISAQQIKVTADNNAAQVLKRVSGIVVRDDKFVTIRGVSDRYNNVLINGSMLPSTEPNRRNFSFDIVPSSMIESIVINKTATPDLQSEFTGGLVQINTKDIPQKNFLEVSAGSGFNAYSTGKQMKSAARYTGDYFAKAGDQRQWFGTIIKPREYVKGLLNDDLEYLAKTGSRVPNNWKVMEYPYAPSQNYQVAGGMTFNHFGFTAGATYRNEQWMEAGDRRNIQSADMYDERYRFSTVLGGMANMAYKGAKHRVSFKNLYNKRFSSQFDANEGRDINNGYSQTTISNILVSRIIQQRLEGEHSFFTNNLLKVDWFADRNTLDREQPDTRYIQAIRGSDGVYYYNLIESPITWGGIYASHLTETRENLGGNMALNFTVLGNKQQLKGGYTYSHRDAFYEGTGFRITDETRGIWSNRLKGLQYYQLASPESVAKGYLQVRPGYYGESTTGDGYDGLQSTYASYIMGDFRFFDKLRVSGGFRFERSDMTVNTAFVEDRNLDSLIGNIMPTEKNWLPSVNLVYSATPKLNVRLSYGKTLARPDFAERTPYIYFDFAEQLNVVGNEGLKTTGIENYDARIEYYGSANEVASFSLFYKDFINPVERFFNLGNPSNSVVYANLGKARVRGIEVDFRKSLGFIAPGSFLKDMYLSGNFSYTKGFTESHEEREDTVTHQHYIAVIKEGRPIQGLSPYVINAALNYQHKQFGFNVAYNRFGRRILYGGTQAPIIQYEHPRDVLDAQVSYYFLKQKMELRLNASDILAQPWIVYSNASNDAYGGNGAPNKDPRGAAFNSKYDFVNYKMARGTNYSFVLTYKL